MRQLRSVILPLLLVIALAVGCGGDDGGDSRDVEVGDGGPTTSATSATSTTVDPDTAVSSPGSLPGDDAPATPTWTRVEATHDLVDPAAAVPDEVVADPDDPNAVLVRFHGGVQECYGARAGVFGADDTVVRILLETGRRADAGDQPCIEIAEAQELKVELDEPVGARELLAVDPADADEGAVDG